MELKTSVIIPVYNREKTLKQCLSSVLNQTYKNYEIIVIDNNSTDRTKQIIKDFQKKAIVFKTISEKEKEKARRLCPSLCKFYEEKFRNFVNHKKERFKYPMVLYIITE